MFLSAIRVTGAARLGAVLYSTGDRDESEARGTSRSDVAHYYMYQVSQFLERVFQREVLGFGPPCFCCAKVGFIGVPFRGWVARSGRGTLPFFNGTFDFTIFVGLHRLGVAGVTYSDLFGSFLYLIGAIDFNCQDGLIDLGYFMGLRGILGFFGVIF